MDLLPADVYTLPGWCSHIKADRLYNLVVETKPELSVELGVYGGRSFLPLALGHKANNKGRAVGVDPWSAKASVANYAPEDINYRWWINLDHESIYGHLQTALTEHSLHGHTEIKRCRSLDVVDAFGTETIDILHQDGNHSEVGSCLEVNRYCDKVKHNGFWVMDDTDWPSTKKAQNLLLECGFVMFEDYGNWAIFQRS
jgi:hypothetical protein